ncbi:MAG: alpha-2-macroglobulin, partial [Bacteroidetes bacterium HGW-Bacteroidetes-23]
ASGVQILRDSTGLPGAASLIKIRGMASINNDNRPLFIIDGVPFLSDDKDISGYLTLNSNDISDISVLKGDAATALYGARANNGVVIITTKKALEEATKIAPRKNLKETAFFYPHLATDSKGEVSFTFDSPEALTRWKLMLLAHDKSLSSGSLIKEAITQKELMVIPNPPRFLREKDTIVFSTKINNLTAETRTGTAVLQLFDAQNMEEKNIILGDKSQSFSVASKGNMQVSWTLAIPDGLQGLQYKITAMSGNFSDGEENVLPVLSNRTLVTEAIPLMVRPGATKTADFDKLKNNTSSTLENHQLIFEYTSNPAWYAIQSLPYLMEFPHECAEQTFSRYYANSISEFVINNNPKIKEVFDTWRNNDALVSAFEKNSELKSILIAETPWLQDSQTEAEQKNRLSLLFDLEKNSQQITTILSKLTEMQMESGGFPWFDGGRENQFITRHIVSGFGHLKKLGIKHFEDEQVKTLLTKALKFLDSKFVEHYEIEQKPEKNWANFHFGVNYIQFLYARSFFLDEFKPNEKTQLAIDFYLKKVEKNWLVYNSYEKAMMVLFLTRTDHKELAKRIWVSLDESAVKSAENGMYWKDNQPGWLWYQAPVE